MTVQTMRHSLSLILLLLFSQYVCIACNNGKDEDAALLDWSDYSLWYEGDQRLQSIDKTKVDVFYLLPTCVFAWNDEKGNTHYNADPYNDTHRDAWSLSAQLADTIFASDANLFIPYYRQATFEGLTGAVAKTAEAVAVNDAIDAFDYYLSHFNNNRPFILAGYSQGGKMVTEILKHIDDNTYENLIAAYVVGNGITAQDTVTQANHRTSHIKLAKDASSRGVTINFNSVTTTDAICPLLCTDNIGCINPVSWTTSAQPATLLDANDPEKTDDPRFPYGTAVVALDKSKAVMVSVDQRSHVLVVDNIDPNRYFLPSFQNFFPLGNLHLQELFFYGNCLRENVKLRSKH